MYWYITYGWQWAYQNGNEFTSRATILENCTYEGKVVDWIATNPDKVFVNVIELNKNQFDRINQTRRK